MKEHEWNNAIHPQNPETHKASFYHTWFTSNFLSLLIPSTIATIVHIKHEISQLKMMHLSQFIQVRNPMRNMKMCLNLTKTLENSNYKIYIFYFSICKNRKNSKTTKQNKYSKIENRKYQQNRISIQKQKTDKI